MTISRSDSRHYQTLGVRLTLNCSMSGLEFATKSTESMDVIPSSIVYYLQESLMWEMEGTQIPCVYIARNKMNVETTLLCPTAGASLRSNRERNFAHFVATSKLGVKESISTNCQRHSKMLSEYLENSANDTSGLTRFAQFRMTKKTGRASLRVWKRSSVWPTVRLLLPPPKILPKDFLGRGQRDST